MVCSTKWMFAALLILPVAAQAQIQPGQWQTTVTIKSMDMPDAPPQIAQMMRSRMAGGKPTQTSYCVTAEQAAKGPQELLKQNPSCRFTKFSTANGVIATEMTCAQNGGTMTARGKGTYTADSFDVSSTAVISGQMSMQVTSNMVGRRIGPCTGK